VLGDVAGGAGPGLDRVVDLPVGDGPAAADVHGYEVPFGRRTTVGTPAAASSVAVRRGIGRVRGRRWPMPESDALGPSTVSSMRTQPTWRNPWATVADLDILSIDVR
jgi:hypothetical protein